MTLVTRKPVFGVCDQIRLKPACSAIETSKGLESRGIILSRRQTTKALIRLRGCAGWSAPLLFAYGKKRFLMKWLICKYYTIQAANNKGADQTAYRLSDDVTHVKSVWLSSTSQFRNLSSPAITSEMMRHFNFPALLAPASSVPKMAENCQLLSWRH